MSTAPSMAVGGLLTLVAGLAYESGPRLAPTTALILAWLAVVNGVYRIQRDEPRSYRGRTCHIGSSPGLTAVAPGLGALTGPPGVRTSEENVMLKNLMFVTLYVTDQDRALEFYTDRLGLQKRVDATNQYGRFLTVAPGDGPVEILLRRGNPGQPTPVDAAEPDGVLPGPVFIESDDLVKDFELLRSRGVTFVEEAPKQYEFGVLLTALDPDGNRIELRQRPAARRGDG